MRQYKIDFKGIGVGEHTFLFDISDTFFEHFNDSEIKSGSIKCKLIMQKKANLLVLNFNISGIISVPCDRCLEYFNMTIKAKDTLFVKFGEEKYDVDDELLVLDINEHEIDVSNIIYEIINVNIPIRKVHPEDEFGNSTCNSEMVKKLESYLHKPKKKTIDSRWNKLNDLTK